MTALRANWELADRGLLRLHTPAKATLSDVWQLVMPSDLNRETDLQIGFGVMDYVTTIAHDVFRRRGLGKAGALVWCALEGAGPMTVKELAEVTARDPSTVRRKLNAMFNVGLAEPLGDGLWQAVEDADLDQAARELGTAGAAQRQKEEHARDRLLHKRGLELLGPEPARTAPDTRACAEGTHSTNCAAA